MKLLILILLTVTAALLSSVFWLYVCDNAGVAIILNAICCGIIGWIAGYIFAEKFL